MEAYRKAESGITIDPIQSPWLLVVVPLALLGVGLMMLWPRIWIASFFLSLPFFLTDTGDGLTAQEVVIGAFAGISVICWTVWRLATQPTPLVRTWFDVLLIIYVGASLLNFFIAYANGVKPVTWASEWVLLVLMLYYFPIREIYGGSNKDVNTLMVVGALSSVAMCAVSIYSYKNRTGTAGIQFAYQIWASRSVLLGPFFLMTMILALTMSFHTRGFWKKVFQYAVFSINAIALLLTFTRTLWVFFFFCMAIVLAFLRWHQSLRLVITSLAITGVLVTALGIAFPRITDIAVTVIKTRFQSSTMLTGGDHSFEARLQEADAVWRATKGVPIGGNGLRAKYIAKTAVTAHATRTAFVHIGYVSLVFKLGIPMALLFMTILGTTFWSSIRSAYLLRAHTADPVLRSVGISMLAFIPAMLATIFVAGVVDTRYGNVMFAFVFACVGILHDRTRTTTTHE